MKNILVTLELKERSTIIIDKAKEIAEKFNAKVWLLHVAAPDPDFVGYEVGPQYIRDSRAEELKEEHRFLQDFADNLRKSGIEAQGILLQGATIEMIISESKKLEVDLIVMGHHKSGLLEKIFGSSTANDVLNKSHTPLLIIPLD